jgi:hypothetical protein
MSIQEEVLRSVKSMATTTGTYYHRDDVLIAMDRLLERYNLKLSSKEPMTEKEQLFMKEVAPFVSIYGKEMCREFYDYWSEPTKTGLMRWNKEATWKLSSRLRRWSKSNNGKGSSTEQTSTKFKRVD